MNMTANRHSRRRVARPSTSCRTALCVFAHGPAHDRCEIMGPFRLPTRDAATGYVRSFVVGATPEQREQLIDWIATWGDCVLHAASVVFGKPCYCATCRPDVRRFA